MALVTADRVKMTTTTTGTGALTLGSAVTGFRDFSAIGDGNTAYCCCYGVDSHGIPTGQWEVFLGTYTASGTTLDRTTRLSSSTGSAINFSAGTKHVITCFPADNDAQLAILGITAAGKALIDDASAGDQRTTLGLGSIATQNASSVEAQSRRPVNAQTGTTYTLVLGDEGKLVTLSNASAITLTVPPNGDVAFPTGTEVDLAQLGAGVVTVAAGSGVTIHSAGGLLDLSDQYAGATLKKLGTNTWLLVGSLA